MGIVPFEFNNWNWKMGKSINQVDGALVVYVVTLLVYTFHHKRCVWLTPLCCHLFAMLSVTVLKRESCTKNGLFQAFKFGETSKSSNWNFRWFNSISIGCNCFRLQSSLVRPWTIDRAHGVWRRRLFLVCSMWPCIKSLVAHWLMVAVSGLDRALNVSPVSSGLRRLILSCSWILFRFCQVHRFVESIGEDSGVLTQFGNTTGLEQHWFAMPIEHVPLNHRACAWLTAARCRLIQSSIHPSIDDHHHRRRIQIASTWPKHHPLLLHQSLVSPRPP